MEGRRMHRGSGKMAAVMLMLVACAFVVYVFIQLDVPGRLSRLLSAPSAAPHQNVAAEEVVAANEVVSVDRTGGGVGLAQQYAAAKGSNDARFGASVKAEDYKTGYTEESKVDCGGCTWVLRDLDQCCERNCNADTTYSPYYCSGSSVAGDKMYDCHPAMCKESTMGKCSAAALKALRDGTNTMHDARCATHKRKVKVGSAVQTCARMANGKCVEW